MTAFRSLLILQVTILLAACSTTPAADPHAAVVEGCGRAAPVGSAENADCLIRGFAAHDAHRQAERSGPAVRQGTPVYSADECIGPVINGECHGSILPKAGYRPTCHGQMLFGRCTGPMF